MAPILRVGRLAMPRQSRLPRERQWQRRWLGVVRVCASASWPALEAGASRSDSRSRPARRALSKEQFRRAGGRLAPWRARERRARPNELVRRPDKSLRVAASRCDA
jgi:hypothetical protein